MSFSIPPEINSWDRYRAAQFYHGELGWAVHALCPPNKGQDKERGKKPIARGWRDHRAAEVTPEYLREHFSNGSNYNLGVVVRGPFVHVDLDSKPDGGQSVRQWLEGQPDLLDVPRERTGGGAHLIFICRDLPESVSKNKKSIASQINEAVTAELYTDGMNIVVSPSVHKGGTRYEWEVTGTIPEVRWDQISRWFGFNDPGAKKRGRPGKEMPWWAKFKGALHTLDAVAMFREAGFLGECIDPDEGKWSVTCPWEREHSEPGKSRTSATVIFASEGTDSPPGFRCLHAHCAERSMKEVIEAVEAVLDLPADALDRTRASLRENGNLSSASVLDVLRATMADPPPPGSFGLMVAMGPGFCSELVLLGW